MNDCTATRFSSPADGAASLFDRYEAVLDIVWSVAFGYRLDPWQRWILRLVTELTPFGTLRHSQFLISLGRQNGKTEIAAALGLLFMLWKPSPYVVGIASSADQARLVYERVMRAIRPNPSLAAKFVALTDTRGLRSKTGGKYEIKAAKSAALQGLPLDLGIVDEVHLVKQALWTDMVNGLGSRPDCIVVGITTAGDDDSELLKHLYKLADEGKIGHAIYEAPEPRIPDDDDTLWSYLLAANPSLRTRPERREAVIETVRTMPPADAIRYRLNLFTGSTGGYLTLAQVAPLAATLTPPRSGAVLVIERTPTWSHGSITAAWVAKDGAIETQVVASISSPTTDKLVALAVALAGRTRLFVADGYSLGPVIDELKRRGFATKRATLGDVTGAASRLYARVTAGTLRHAGDPLFAAQLPRTATKAVGENYRLVRGSKDAEIDVVIGTSLAVYFAETAPENGPQLFI